MDRNRFQNTYIVSPGGLADYTAIQAAIDAGHARALTADKPWLVLVYPGHYAEQLTLYDYVDVKGIGFVAIENRGDAIIKTAASCRLENLFFEADDDLISPAVIAGVAGATLVMKNITYGRLASIGGTFLKLAAGTVTLEDCQLDGGFPEVPVIEQSGGALNMWRCLVQANTLLATANGVIKISGGSQDVHHSRIIAATSAALHALYFSAVPASTRWLHCSFHAGATAAAINNASGSSIPATLGHYAVNYARAGAFTGLNDVVVDTGV